MQALLGEVTLHLTDGKWKNRRVESRRPAWDSKPQTVLFSAEDLGEAFSTKEGGLYFSQVAGCSLTHQRGSTPQYVV